MQQGDQAWWRLAEKVSAEDRDEAAEYNLRATAEVQLALEPGPVPFSGALMTAPVVMLLSHPRLEFESAPDDAGFHRAGWPLAALHPDAPAGLAEWWRARLSALIDVFGAQHVANAVAAVYLTPWRSVVFDSGLRLPSRRRMLALAASAASRDAILVMTHSEALWTEEPAVASLPMSRCVRPRSWRGTEVSVRSLGDAWSAICKRIEVHAW